MGKTAAGIWADGGFFLRLYAHERDRLHNWQQRLPRIYRSDSVIRALAAGLHGDSLEADRKDLTYADHDCDFGDSLWRDDGLAER